METQIKISSFSGEKKDWECWSVTFLSKARLRGYRNILVGIRFFPEKGSKGYDDYIFKNDIAYAELLISCDCDICLGIGNTSSSEQIPEGDTRLVWRNLLVKYEPNTKANSIKLKKEFTESKIKGL
jgi:hypothetical protein